MATVDKSGTVTLQELVVSSLAQTDAVTKLLIEKGVFTQDEFMEKIKAERTTYQAMFQKAISSLVFLQFQFAYLQPYTSTLVLPYGTPVFVGTGFYPFSLPR